jgi:hypothetical protein
MTEDIQHTRNNFYNNASPVQRYLYSHPESGQKLSALAKKFSISDLAYKVFVNIAGDVVLGLHQPQDMSPLLEQSLGTDPVTAQSIARDLLDFLAPLSDPTWRPPTDELAAEVSEMESLLANQFQQNQSPEPTYTSTQAAILREGEVSTIPVPPVAGTPRWNSEQRS